MMGDRGKRVVFRFGVAIFCAAVVLLLADRVSWLFSGLAGPVPLLSVFLAARSLPWSETVSRWLVYFATVSYFFCCVEVAVRL